MAAASRIRRGEWSPMLLAIIVALIVLGLLIFFWTRQGGSMMAFIQGLFGIVPAPP